MHSIHAKRWIENLNDNDHELYWYDVLNKGKFKLSQSVTQFYNINKRKVSHFKGEYFLSKKVPYVYNCLKKFIEVTPNEALDEIINKIQPDIVHSFEMQSCSYPIFKTMQKYPEIKWVYSCWGSDLYYYQNFNKHRSKLINVLNRVDYILTDCYRDFDIANKLGYKGKFLDVIPGGGGYSLNEFLKYKKNVSSRKLILIKGYQHDFGRALNVIKALETIYVNYQELEFVVFGAHNEVISYIEQKKLPFKIYHRDELSQNEILKLMGESLVYIGNSISDGIPNTLLEAIIMGVFPIQSNPGNATSEIIQDRINGFLINDAENIEEIRFKIKKILGNKELIEKASIFNYNLALEKLDYKKNKVKINKLYKHIAE